uniref:calpain-2 catalytic subunit-like n=1 Tax=Monopterus albus TaxID=43700 RepID=UPI0009B3F818|nr:calpain-2 catalytic subunit-like [Monopterus albus]
MYHMKIGSWAPGSTAGGSYKDTYYQNPQFKLVLKEQDQTEDEDKTKKCTVVVELLLKNTRNKNEVDITSKDFDIYKVPPDFQGVRLDPDFFKQNKPIEHPYIYRSIRNVVCKLRLDPGNYIIVAFNKDPKQSRKFLVRTFSKTGNTLG